MLWHYTTLRHLLSIQKSGRIQSGPRWQPHAWFSSNQDWENSVNEQRQDEAILKTKDEMAADGIARIGIVESDAPIPWEQYKTTLSEQEVKTLEDIKRQNGAEPSEWFLSLGPVSRNKWEAIQVFMDGKWIDCRPETENYPDTPARRAIALIQQFSDAFSEWAAIPPAIIAATKPTIASRNRAQRLLVQNVRKFCEDVGASLSVIGMGSAGATYALLRICRENFIGIMYLAHAPAAEAERYAKYIEDQRPAVARLQLHNKMTGFINSFGALMLPNTRVRIEGAILDEEELTTCERQKNADLSAQKDFSFNELVIKITKLLEPQLGQEAYAFLMNTLDYWMESEVTHSGSSSIEAYNIGGGPWHQNLDQLIDLLRHLIDFHAFAAMTNMALLQSFGAIKIFSLPPVMQRLQNVAHSAQRFIESNHKNA